MTAGVFCFDYAPRKVFAPYHDTPKRWRIIVAHRRAGKTVATIMGLIRTALTCSKPNPRAAYVAPLYKQAKDVAWGYLKQYATSFPGTAVNESELRVDFPNGGRVRLYGADNPDGMRGIYLDDCTLDEFADMRPRMLPEIIRPALADREGGLTLIGTPKGHNDFYEAWRRAQNDNEWYAVMLKASETGLVKESELTSLRKQMTEDQYAQEFECSFDAAIQGAYYGKEMAKAQEAGRILPLEIDRQQPVFTAWDLGIRDATAIWFFQQLSGGLHVVDFYEASGVGLDHYAEKLREKARGGGYQIGTCFVPADAKVKEWGSGRTRIEQMEALQLQPQLVPDHRLMDGIGAARETLAQCRFDKDRCADGIEALKQYRTEFDEERKVMKPTPLHDWTSHAADAFRYLAMSWRAPEKPQDVDFSRLRKGVR